MDLSLLPSPVSEHTNQSSGALFTIRSASSPSYNLSRRRGIRKTRGLSEEGSGRTQGAVESRGLANDANKEENHTFPGYHSRSRWRGGVKGQCEANNTSDPVMSAQPNQNGSADKTKTEVDTGGRINSNPSSERRGRAEWRRHDLPSRSKSLDFRSGKRSPDLDKSQSPLPLSYVRGGAGGTHAGGRGELRTEWEAEAWRARSNAKRLDPANDDKEMSQPSRLSQTLNRGDRGSSLPSRLRSLSGPGSGVRGAPATPTPIRNQSILDRIEKLYGSAGFSKAEDYSRIRDSSKPGPSHHKEAAADFNVSPQQRSHDSATGGTFPRRFFSGSTNSPGTSSGSSPRAQNNAYETSPSPGTARSSERLLRGERLGQAEDGFSENRGPERGRATENLGTMSLDRVRSRCSIFSQLRSARAAGELIIPPAASTQEEEPPTWRDSLKVERERGGAGGKGRAGTAEPHQVDSTPRGRGRVFKEEEEEEKTDGAKIAFKCSVEEDVFEAQAASEQRNNPEVTPASSAESVKNRINQFEALTQRSHDLAPGRSLPRRTFSVPTQVNGDQVGVKKSRSAKAIGNLKDRREGLKQAGEVEEMFSRPKAGSVRPLLADEVGLRLKERDRIDLEHSSNHWDESIQKYSKNTLEVPLKREHQGPNGGFNVDETDFTKASSPEEARSRPTFLLLHQDSTTGGWQTSPSPSEDKTPSPTPTNSPHLSPTLQPTSSTLTHREAPTASTVEAKSPKLEPPLVSAPPTASVHSFVPQSPNRSKQLVLDMDAWLSGLSTEINVWNNQDDSEDDDASTQKDDDSNYDSDSGESSITITSSTSQSEQKSFSLSLSDLCNFAGVDFESENEDNDDNGGVLQVNTRRTASMSSDMSAFSYVSVLPTEELDKLLDDVRSLGDNNLQDYNAVQVVVLHKEMGMGLGFSVAGGVDQNKPVTVHRVLPSGVAAQEGSIQEGDAVLSINGTSLCSCTHWEALRVLRRARIRNLGVVVLRRGEVSNVSKTGEGASSGGSKQTQATEKGQRVCVRLEKKGRDLGFSLEGGVGSSLENRPIRVQKIFQGGPVEHVRPGDEVLEVDGVSTTGMRRIEAWNLIRKLPAGPVDLVLSRPHKET